MDDGIQERIELERSRLTEEDRVLRERQSQDAERYQKREDERARDIERRAELARVFAAWALERGIPKDGIEVYQSWWDRFRNRPVEYRGWKVGEYSVTESSSMDSKYGHLPATTTRHTIIINEQGDVVRSAYETVPIENPYIRFDSEALKRGIVDVAIREGLDWVETPTEP